MSTRLYAAILIAVLLPAVLEASPKLPPPRHADTYVVAHRGAHKGIPENTLAAYAKAIELGADFVEIDVRVTRDGHLVSFHDSAFPSNLFSEPGNKIAEMTLSEIKAVDIGSRVDPRWSHERLPTLEEILSLCKGKVGIYLDLKSAPVKAVLDVVQRYGMEDQVLWYANGEDLRQLRKLSSDAILMPDPGPLENLSSLLEEFKPIVVAAVWKHFSKDMVKLCHAQGAKIIVDEGEVSPPENIACWEEALAAGADGIQTDHPEELIEFLKSRVQSHGDTR